MTGPILALLAATLLLAIGWRWLQRMQRVQIPGDMRPYLAGTALAALLGIAAFIAGVGLFAGIAAALAIVGGVAFLALYSASGQAKRTPAVAVGGPVVEFTARDDGGNPFDLASLRGTPFLLKFFRGHWCPYCVAELRRWEELRPELDARGIAVVTVCAIPPSRFAAVEPSTACARSMLPDPALAITDRYNLRNPKNFAPKPGIIIPLPIPTTILVDAGGIVRWIDQASDYMHRSDPERVLSAIRATLGDGSAAARADVPTAAAG